LTKESTEEYGKELFEEEQQEEILQPAQQQFPQENHITEIPENPSRVQCGNFSIRDIGHSNFKGH